MNNLNQKQQNDIQRQHNRQNDIQSDIQRQHNQQMIFRATFSVHTISRMAINVSQTDRFQYFSIPSKLQINKLLNIIG